MTSSKKTRAREIMAKTGVSYAGAINQMKKGQPKLRVDPEIKSVWDVFTEVVFTPSFESIPVEGGFERLVEAHPVFEKGENDVAYVIKEEFMISQVNLPHKVVVPLIEFDAPLVNGQDERVGTDWNQIRWAQGERMACLLELVEGPPPELLQADVEAHFLGHFKGKEGVIHMVKHERSPGWVFGVLGKAGARIRVEGGPPYRFGAIAFASRVCRVKVKS